MDVESVVGDEGTAEASERTSLCLSDHHSGKVLHAGDPGFQDMIRRHSIAPESDACERLAALKRALRDASISDFWSTLTEGMAQLTGAQYALVSKRILLDDEDAAVEIPPIGEPNSCLMAEAFYYNDGHGLKGMYRNWKHFAHGSPCGHMRHNKAFIIPEKLNDFITSNPNKYPFPAEAFLGLPLFADGKCFAHYGVMWSLEGAARRSLSWGFLEVILQSLEGLILERLLHGQGFHKKESTVSFPASEKVIPHEAVTGSQSLKPYARSLSHELRTPMQGVVGMLDVMHATVQEAVENQVNRQVRMIFQSLRENIEVVQDSSRRAVEAADNVVHAYDLNMEVPDTPIQQSDDADTARDIHSRDKRPNILIEGHNLAINHSTKKRRRSNSIEWNVGRCPKQRKSVSHYPGHESPRPSVSAIHRRTVSRGDDLGVVSPKTRIDDGRGGLPIEGPATPADPEDESLSSNGDLTVTPGLKHAKIRDVLQDTINESLRSGGRPDSAIAVDTPHGERIEARSRNSKGDASTKVIEWSVDPAVPETVFVDERDLTKLVSCVFLNAVKFTEQGEILVTANLTPKGRSIVITIKDTGPGIPQNFVPNLFKAFSREDDSLTRQKDGLGLGLLVAKGLARKIGGDIVCLRSDTFGPNRGSEFEIRVPLSSSDASSLPGTPYARTPTPTPSNSLARFSLDGSDGLHPRFGGSPPNGHPPDTTRRVPRSVAVANSSSPNHTSDRQSPLAPSSSSRRNSLSQRETVRKPTFDRKLAEKHPLNFLVVDDNKINRKLLVNMLLKLGYKNVHEAYDGVEAVRQMEVDRHPEVDVVLMDLWMPNMDGYEAAGRILSMPKYSREASSKGITVLAVTADVTGGALERAAEVGMEGFMTKPYKLQDLERLIVEYCSTSRDRKQGL
ncbi:MAG: hypothetical protein M1833_003221 [Piccolia ochrophora]|nr:MAG: hypothetical protein M1833_003221 [Piccolia ochrophora]